MSNQKRGIPAWYWFFITFFGGGIILISIVAFFVIVPFNLKFPDEAKQALDQEIQSHSQIGEHVIGTTRYDIKKTDSGEPHLSYGTEYDEVWCVEFTDFGSWNESIIFGKCEIFATLGI